MLIVAIIISTTVNIKSLHLISATALRFNSTMLHTRPELLLAPAPLRCEADRPSRDLYSALRRLRPRLRRRGSSSRRGRRRAVVEFIVVWVDFTF